MTKICNEIIKGTYIEYMSPELLFLGQSGQPYRGTVYIQYLSSGYAFNLLELKKTITAFRKRILWAEDIAAKIYQAMPTELMKEVGVVVDLTARGGIQQTISFGKYFEPNRDKRKIFQL